jgi:hypothetical protein
MCALFKNNGGFSVNLKNKKMVLQEVLLRISRIELFRYTEQEEIFIIEKTEDQKMNKVDR